MSHCTKISIILLIILGIPWLSSANETLILQYNHAIPPYIYQSDTPTAHTGSVIEKMHTLLSPRYTLHTVHTPSTEPSEENTTSFSPNTLIIAEENTTLHTRVKKLFTVAVVPYVLYYDATQLPNGNILKALQNSSIGYVSTSIPPSTVKAYEKFNNMHAYPSYSALKNAVAENLLQAIILPEGAYSVLHIQKNYTPLRTPLFFIPLNVYMDKTSPLLPKIEQYLAQYTQKKFFFPLSKANITLLISLILCIIGITCLLVRNTQRKQSSISTLVNLTNPATARYALCFTDTKEIILHISPEIKTILGYEPKYFLGKPLASLYTKKEDVSSEFSTAHSKAKEQVLSTVDHVGNTKTLYLFPVEQQKGDRHYYIILDATDMLKQEKVLSTKLTVYDAMFSKAPIGIARCSLEGNFIHTNTTFNTMLHLNKNYLAEYTIINTLGEPIQTVLREIIENGYIEHKVYTIPSQQNHDPLWVILYAIKTDDPEDSDAPYIDFFIIDITPTYTSYNIFKEKTEHLKNIIENLPDPTFIVNEKKEIIVWNKALENLTGVDKKDIIGKGHNAYSIPFYGHARNMAVDYLFSEEAQQEHKRSITLEAFCPALQGGRYLLISARAVYNHHNELSAVIQTMQDITEQKEQLQNLEQSKRRYTMVVEASNAGVWEWNVHTKSLFISPRCYDILQIPSDTPMPFASIAAQLHPNDLTQIQNQMQLMHQGLLEKSDIIVSYTPQHSSRTKWIHAKSILDKNTDSSINGIIGSITDITEQKEHENTARIIFLISNAVNITHEPQVLFKTTHNILTRYAKYTGLHVVLWHDESIEYIYAVDAEDNGDTPQDITTMPIYNVLVNALRSGKQSTFSDATSSWLITPLRVRNTTIGAIINNKTTPDISAEVFFENDKELMNAIGEQLAIAIERYKNEEQLTEMALHDPLTGLPNRALMSDRLEHAIRRAERNSTYRFAVFMLDLDRFKLINDTHGHNTGDLLLIEIATRLKPLVRSEDTIARLGGDEFAILLENVSSTHEVLAIAKRILKAIEAPLHIDGKELRTATSIGIVLDASHYNSAHALLRDADIAMYDAKINGKGRFRVFDQAMHQQMIEYVSLETDLSNAIKESTLHLVFQPIIRSTDRALLGFEALVRWNHPEKGLIPPSKFIPIAEENGLIIPLGNWVLEKACSTMTSWVSSYPPAAALTVAVNLSAKQAIQSTLKKTILDIIEKTGINPSQLKLEITETTIMSDPTNAMKNFAELREMGVQLAIDDFGTGYSSMSYLQKFPVNTLKIDSSFINDLTEKKEGGFAIVQAICALAHGLGIDVVAEGVETEEQADVLISCNCEALQGYLFSQPLPEQEARQYIMEHTIAL